MNAPSRRPDLDATPPRGTRTGVARATSLDLYPDERPLSATVGLLWRRRTFLAAWILAVASPLIAFVFLGLAPRYRAEALVALDARQIQFSEVSAVVSNPGGPLDPSFVRSEVALLSSTEMARRAVRDLGLDRDPDFAPRPPRLARLAATGALLAEAGGRTLAPLARGLRDLAATLTPPPPEVEARFAAAVEAYRRALSVSNDGRSYVIGLSFEAPTPALAARIVNRHAEIYIDHQRQLKDQALASATRWLDREVARLAERLSQAEGAVQDYREEHRLLSARGMPITQQQLGEVGSQLALARVDRVQREARLQRALASADGSASEILNSAIINSLRLQELAARQSLNEMLGRYGDRHPIIPSVRAQLQDVQRTIETEQAKILQSLQAEADIARRRQEELERAVSDLEDLAARTERDEAGSRAPERESSALRALYESLLGRQKQVATQVGIQQADAHLASPAAAPRVPSYPNRPLFSAVALMFAGLTGAGAALCLGRRTRTGLRRTAELEAATGLRCLAALPMVDGPGLALPDQVAMPRHTPAAGAVQLLRAALGHRGRGGPPRVLAVTSAVAGEGKTSVALALGRSLARSGASVLLVEADLRHGALRRVVLPHVEGDGRRAAGTGLVAVLRAGMPLETAVARDRRTSLHILAAEVPVEASYGLLESRGFEALIRTATERYDHVLVDAPSLVGVAEGLLAAGVADAVLLVVRAGTTPAARVAEALALLEDADLPLRGTVLNRVDPALSGSPAPARADRGRRAPLADG